MQGARLFVFTAEPASGAAQYVKSQVLALRGAGVPVSLLCPSNYAYRAEVEAAGAEVIQGGYRPIQPAGLAARIIRNIRYSLANAACLFGAVRAGDVVHFQFLPPLPLSIFFILLAVLKRCRVVLTAHDPLPHRWVYSQGLRGVELSMLRWTYRLSTAVIVHNDSGKAVLRDKFQEPESKIAVIPHGPLFPGETPPPLPVSDRLKLLLFGSIRENKGVHLAVQAVQQLNATAPQPLVELTIAGELARGAEASYWESCRRLIEKDPRMIHVVHRYIADEEIPKFLADHHALLLPYQDFQSESGVAALALTNRRAILATRAGGLGELLDRSGCGFAIASPDVASVIQTIRMAFQAGNDGLAAMAARGEKFLKSERTWEEIALRTAQLYTSITARPQMAATAPPYRIFLHTPEPASSPALYVTHLASALAQRGVPVEVICPANYQSLGELESDPRIAVHLSASRSTEAGGLLHKAWANTRFLLSSCATLVRGTHPGDLIHFQYVLHFPLGALFFLVARLRKLRIVFTVHDPIPHKWLLPKGLSWISRASLRWAYDKSDILIVHSEAGKQTLVNRFGQAPDRVAVVVHGPYPFRSGLTAAPPSPCLELLLFGAIRENKGVHLAIEAVQRLHRQGVPVRLTIAGRVLNRSESGYWERCRQSIVSGPEPIQVREEFIPDGELPDLFQRAHALLLPYTDFASDSGVAFMALANGRAILATRAGGLGALLDTAGGVVIEEATADGICDAIRKAVAMGPEELAQLGASGAQYVLNECGWPRVAEHTEQLYRALVAPMCSEPVSGESAWAETTAPAPQPILPLTKPLADASSSRPQPAQLHTSALSNSTRL
jgi:glycosyltransferase involved in cell wall biosynthesis